MGDLLDRIQKENDIKQIEPKDYRELAKEIRYFLIQNISRTGGHLSSNLGVVELTMALHLCCDLPNDEIVWDVGHQGYVHKILTGRKDSFDSLRQYGGLSGFPKRKESKCDIFDTGHSSTSVSAALGLVRARDILGEDRKIFAVIGDGALSGGMAYEALNNAARLKSNLVIVLNDNQMSIAPNVGGMSNYLGKIRTNNNYTDLKEDVENILKKMPRIGNALTERIRGAKDLLKRVFISGMLFEDMGLTYIGPINGHDVGQLVTAFESATQAKEAVIVHVKTRKGMGYKPAQSDPAGFHGVAPFHVKDGQPRGGSNGLDKKTYTDIFAEEIVSLARENNKITAVSAAMPSGTGLMPFAKEFPERFFDVGIAEEHAVTFAAGMAAGGLLPVVAIYSTFLQRAYDQILHDVCISGFPVVFAVDRAGLVGSDGETHQGAFDIAYLRTIPGMTVLAPKNGNELRDMLKFAVGLGSPVAIRYPRGTAYMGMSERQSPIRYGKSEILCDGQGVAILAVGSMVSVAMDAGELLTGYDINPTVVNSRFVKPFDEECLKNICEKHSLVVTLEEGVLNGGFGQAVAEWYANNDSSMAVITIGLPDKFIEHGSVSLLKEKYGLNAESVAEKIKTYILGES